MKSIRMLLLSGMALVFFSATAFSQEATIFAGGIFPGHTTVGNIVSSLDRGPLYGVRLSLPFVLILKLEGSLGLSNDFLYPSDVVGVTSSKGVLLDANVVAGIPFGKMIPYATAGLGVIHQYGSADLPVGTKLGVNFGGGVKFPKLFGPAGLRFDARSRSALRVFSRAVNMFEFSAGVMFSF